MTVYWVVWDAAAHWVVDRLEREGALPAVSRMRRDGVLTAARPAYPNCQTPPSLATLFTGTWPREHGVTGFTVPGAGEGLDSHVSGFAPGFPAVPPVWEVLAAHDLSSAFVHTPWVFDETGRVGSHVDVAVEAYSRRLTRHAALAPRPGEQDWRIGGFDVAVTAPARPSDPVRLTAADSPAGDLVLGTDGEWRPLALDGDHGTWVTRLVVDGRLTLVHTGVWRPRTAGRNRAALRRLAECPPFAGEGVGPLYREGVFGPRLAEGGDGTAEEVFLSSVECVAEHFAAATGAVLETHDADLVVVYLPMTDDVGHELLGWCDERSAAHRPDISEAVWARVRRCYQWCDTVLGRVLDRAGAEDTVLLGADHGMVGSTHLVHLGDALLRAGLSHARADGGLDAERSAVFYHPANNGSLWVGPGLAGDPEGARAAMRRAHAVLRTLTDPETGRPVVTGFLDRDHLRPADPDGDPFVSFVVLADDYQPTARPAGDGAVVRRTPKTGAHVVHTGDDRLHAVHAALGSGVPAGPVPPLVDNTWPARLVRHVLGAAPAGPGGAAVTFPNPPKRVDGMPSGFPPARSAADLVERRHRNVAAFLAGRSLEAKWLSDLMRERVGEGLLLLTSSPVHGLANPTSDLDFIRVQEAPIDGPRISTKIFEDGHHLEVVSFSRAELASNLEELHRLAGLPVEETVAGFRRWDKEREPRRKQTERIVNGLTLDGSAPFVDWLPPLGRVWSRASLQLAVEQAVHCLLAESAGETRGRVGYAYNVLLHLMDALLSHHGDVYTTRKWYALRWTRMTAQGGWHDNRLEAVATDLERLRKGVGATLRPSAATEPLAGAFAALTLDAVRATGTASAVTVAVEAEGPGVVAKPFLPDASLLLNAGSAVVLPGVGAEDGLPLAGAPVGLDELAGLDARSAATLLRGLRAGVARLRIGYPDGTAR
ncbi:alkaline phosphatase family protein [Streptomyces sp. OF3]|uniref:Alkaline phosphatase family protein n=1 Tax=Streptomyces alkaliterrae TaxID=2213162 RepID=A0A7W3WJK0_9ACTN|nr:DUF6001 family protein [Streptomyces alkaliterrae]MBB1253548.1 alkaline phosphatase family protein [Streptomyces alkaliterrae]